MFLGVEHVLTLCPSQPSFVTTYMFNTDGAQRLLDGITNQLLQRALHETQSDVLLHVLSALRALVSRAGENDGVCLRADTASSVLHTMRKRSSQNELTVVHGEKALDPAYHRPRDIVNSGDSVCHGTRRRYAACRPHGAGTDT